MTEADPERFRALIKTRLAALDEEDRLGRDGQKAVELDQQAVGRLSRQDALQSQAMAKATQARRDIAKRGLKDALARIDEGEFGYCEECGEAIAVKRLELDPTARRCISCAR
ncbi:DnaK suppressor protein [Roseivivax halotolerans]|uniref:DnaK suppressor protein n=1 Tax=Roseivivax halotolerans TaxID=93684 RepID=A0A1I5W5W9_9RHOB|nr:TraR/DksA C4-type zinc finger protein [Roseivivax halotolerans]SFQ15154.1 DnaK suppressor protein [Roseivivax halotolerans]